MFSSPPLHLLLSPSSTITFFHYHLLLPPFSSFFFLLLLHLSSSFCYLLPFVTFFLLLLLFNTGEFDAHGMVHGYLMGGKQQQLCTKQDATPSTLSHTHLCFQLLQLQRLFLPHSFFVHCVNRSVAFLRCFLTHALL